MKIYQKAEIEIINFCNDDVIKTSGGENELPLVPVTEWGVNDVDNL